MVVSISHCYCSPLRLLAMGDMQGILDDDSDYLYDIGFLAVTAKNNVSISNLSNSFKESLPQNNFTPAYPSDVLDLSRSGDRSASDVDAVYRFSSWSAMCLHYQDQSKSYNSSYVVSTSETDQLSRQGTTDQAMVGLGFDVADWMSIGLGYDYYSSLDKYDGTQASRTGVRCEETGLSQGMFYGVLFHSPSFYFSLGLGGNDMSQLTTKDLAGNEIRSYQIEGPANAHLLIGGKMFDGKLGLRYGAFIHKTPEGLEGRSLMGMQIIPVKWITIGAGYIMDIYEWSCAYKTNFGLEWAFTDAFKFRCGIINKTTYSYSIQDQVGDYWWSDYEGKEVSSTDYTAGFEYDINDSLALECAYKNYQSVDGSYDDWMAASQYLAYDNYFDSASSDRNSEGIVSLRYFF